MIRLVSAARFAAILAAFAAAPALAQDSPASSVPPELQGMIGDWNLEQEDVALPKCAITFTEDQAIGGWAAVIPEPCPAPYPVAAALAAWNVDPEDGSVLLLDAERHVTLRLFEDEDGLYDTDPAVVPRFYLTVPYDEDGAGGEADAD
ncbi:MAG: AprI/Inh family metalloprotease inhibitor [Devosia nanyangense]|uniref:AprI/Inh family metalloprotease inhibitor n=1 Tax=Devosia nanyangense TaxID=1228055 RepID=A0A933L5A0_9HYPH|nr:AprI/Inh family metalloprotease inhibitor [Devosia nanyangense]